MRKGGKIRRKKQSGGYLTGPSHEEGGIVAQIPGEDPIELEGGEYIINAQTVNALGIPFLNQINSTATTHHQGGFEQGQLPSPSQYRRGGKIKKMAHGGSHNGSGYGSSSSGNMAQTNLIAQEGEFINRRTGQPVMMGTPYHIHPEKGPMEGAVHNPNIPGGTQGHDFFDKTTNGRNNMRRGGRPSRRKRGGAARRPMKRGGSARPAARKMRRGGRPRRMAHGGLHSRNNSCGPGMMMSNGGCVPMSGGGYRRGGRTRPKRRMMHGGPHPASSMGRMNGTSVANTPSGHQSTLPAHHGQLGGTLNPLAGINTGVNLGPLGRPVAKLNGNHSNLRRGGKVRKFQHGGHAHTVPMNPVMTQGQGSFDYSHRHMLSQPAYTTFTTGSGTHNHPISIPRPGNGRRR